MLKKLTARTIAVVFVLTLVSSFGAAASSSPSAAADRGKKNAARKAKAPAAAADAAQSCSRTSDEQLTNTVKERLEAIPEIRKQMNHLNVSVKNRVVKLEGWLNGYGLVKMARNTASRTRCARNVISKVNTRGGGSCGPGQKLCGDICIDKDSHCNITGGN